MLYNIGYGNDNIDVFIEKLLKYNISDLYDLRSKPMSRWRPQFNRNQFDKTLLKKGIRYHFVGDRLGGYMNKKDWDLELLVKIAKHHSENKNGVILCSEWDVERCHRKELRDFLLEKCYNCINIGKDGNAVNNNLKINI